MSTIEKSTAADVLKSDDGEFSFWNRFLTTISVREARIHGSLDATTVREILINLAEVTRESETFLGNLSVRNVREAYERAIGETPDQAGEQMLMRLCTLGRVAPASPERQFVDNYIVDGLRAEALIRSIDSQMNVIGSQMWRQPLSRFGRDLLYNSLVTLSKEGAYKSALASMSRVSNAQAYVEILSTLLATEGAPIDVQGLALLYCDAYRLVVGKRRLQNLILRSSFIRQLELLPEFESAASNIELDDCIIQDLSGVSSDSGLPGWIKDSQVEKYDSLSSASRIKNSNLDPAHALFLAVIHKIFFQHGAGREEKSLLKGGFGQKYDSRLVHKIINILLREKLIERHLGNDGYIYGPIRRHTRRMSAIKGQLALSEDPLWNEIGTL